MDLVQIEDNLQYMDRINGEDLTDCEIGCFWDGDCEKELRKYRANIGDNIQGGIRMT